MDMLTPDEPSLVHWLVLAMLCLGVWVSVLVP